MSWFLLILHLPWSLCCILHKFEYSLLEKKEITCGIQLLLHEILSNQPHLKVHISFDCICKLSPPSPEFAIWKCFHMLKASLLILLEKKKKETTWPTFWFINMKLQCGQIWRWWPHRVNCKQLCSLEASLLFRMSVKS